MDVHLYGNNHHVLYKLHLFHLLVDLARYNLVHTSYNQGKYKSEIGYFLSLS